MKVVEKMCNIQLGEQHPTCVVPALGTGSCPAMCKQHSSSSLGKCEQRLHCEMLNRTHQMSKGHLMSFPNWTLLIYAK